MRPFLALFLLLAACGAKAPPVTTAALAADAAPAPRTCTSTADCKEHELCAGPPGCEVAWTCVPERPCTMDLGTFCGCDGKIHQGSGSCPPAPYRNVGPCQ